jgi:hypothetical protein
LSLILALCFLRVVWLLLLFVANLGCSVALAYDASEITTRVTVFSPVTGSVTLFHWLHPSLGWPHHLSPNQWHF